MLFMNIPSVSSLMNVPTLIRTCNFSCITNQIVRPIKTISLFHPPVCQRVIGRLIVFCAVIGGKLFTLQYVEASFSVCTEWWLPTQWVRTRPLQCQAHLNYWTPRGPRAWSCSQCWRWPGWRDSPPDCSLSSGSRVSSTSLTHGKCFNYNLQLSIHFKLSNRMILWKEGIFIL